MVRACPDPSTKLRAWFIKGKDRRIKTWLKYGEFQVL
jgi:hypothetical protein